MIFGLGYNTVLVLLGVALLGGAAGVIGCFAVLKRRSLTGDALAHAALPGLCLSYIVVGERNFHALLLGAFVSGLIGIGVIASLRRWTRLKEDAAIAIVLSTFFGLGVVLLDVVKRIEGGPRAGLESFILGKTAGMTRSDLELITYLALGTLALVLVLYKEFKLITFDMAFAQAQGWPALGLDLLLQLMLVVAVIIGLPAVGIVLMAAMLVIPPAAARFWTERLSLLLVLSAAFGMAAGIIGALVSANLERMPTGPLVILVAALIFLISLFLGPRRGMLARWLEQRRYQRQFMHARLLETLYRHAPTGVEAQRLATLLGSRSRRLARKIRQGVSENWLEWRGTHIVLTGAGDAMAAEVVSIKQRWQQMLIDHPQEVPPLLRLDLAKPPDAQLPPLSAGRS